MAERDECRAALTPLIDVLDRPGDRGLSGSPQAVRKQRSRWWGLHRDG